MENINGANPERNCTGEPLLELRDVCFSYQSQGSRSISEDGAAAGTITGINLSLRSGETLALIGESGSGKSTIGRLILGLLKPERGSILIKGEDVTRIKRRRRADLLQSIQVIFQNPLDALNPRMRILDQIAEPAVSLLGVGWTAAREIAAEAMNAVGLPAGVGQRYAIEVSGGQAQRVVIARAISLKPALIVCDEPVSALDVSVQAQILNLLRDLNRQMGVALLFITHDLRIVPYVCKRSAIMERGGIVETGLTNDLFSRPKSTYAAALLNAVPGFLSSERNIDRARNGYDEI
ncbi:ABC transporter ATP-binding protein [Phyllobacterium chamaecytisi]|uniref:ABC transporter ATP-binding protein n=1 Tax=Phyllobacterium chamaecytisi TaxID=2876082 RepID=UPI001CCA1377|nr:ATP-binding cassette domain-containing protein [Phyllobacterium sp. KW56]MBZ9602989.1 ATP-binding cassette domain-containing protein [Phyllobacterium sp. KW56]